MDMEMKKRNIHVCPELGPLDGKGREGRETRLSFKSVLILLTPLPKDVDVDV
jgi:hypothetical protein